MTSVAADNSSTDPGQPGLGLDERWALVVPHREHLVAIAARRCPTQQDAEDCAHEAMLRAVAYRQLDPARVGALLTAMVLRVSANLARRRGAELRGRPRLAMVPAQMVPPDEAVVDHDEAHWLAEQLERLPAREREVFEHRAAGLSAAETARLLELSYKSVESAFTRARGRLRLWATRTAWLLSGSRRWTHLRRRMHATPAHASELVASFVSVATLLVLVVGETALAPPVGTQSVRTPPSLTPRAGMANPASAIQSAAAGTSELHVPPTAAPTNVTPRGVPQPAPDPRLVPLPGPDPKSVWVTDVQASPNYSSDHTLYAAGTPMLCVLSPCAAILKSTDGGHSWISLEALGLVGGMLPVGTHLMLPPAAYAQHRFYAYGESGLQVTTDGGRTFTTVVSQPAVDGVGFAAAAPAGMGFDVMTSLQSLTVYSVGAVPKVVALFPPTMQAFGAPLFVSGPNGPEILQLVQPYEGDIKQMTRLLRCTPHCIGDTQLPQAYMSGLVASPDYARDGTLIAWAPGQAAAISTDWGRTFMPMAKPKGLSWPWGVNVIDGAGHPRLIEWTWPGRTGVLPYYSDDLGVTWHAAGHSGALAHGFDVLDVSAVVTSTRLVAAGAPGPTTDREYVCSTDAGVSWGDCPADN